MAELPPTTAACSFVVIPARLASTRLPRKLLLNATGKPLIQHTYEAARRAHRPSGVCVAADDEELASVVRAFGGEVQLTSPTAPSGTDRVAEVARQLDDVDIVVNLQGDEPEITGEAIDLAVELLEKSPTLQIATLAAPIRDRDRLNDPACVKVVFDHQNRALYFSRSPIPHARHWQDELLHDDPPRFFQHIGLYAYRRSFLLELQRLPASGLEQVECLEQLRFLQAGYDIAVGIIDESPCGIDTEADYRDFVRRWQESNG